jgi:hypothetical protein
MAKRQGLGGMAGAQRELARRLAAGSGAELPGLPGPGLSPMAVPMPGVAPGAGRRLAEQKPVRGRRGGRRTLVARGGRPQL